ncbi:hypothetical protein HOLleu_30985 [Holothuria leucospilota]|uniref:Uncharacterized protein n=1 Tax=Holothuria leucospilota TaxID=206669 RepID=A0A9Q1GXK6_HOLLE|nr:hypothetical protein HOLleu_30985 [Holothuria leucospilota]
MVSRSLYLPSKRLMVLLQTIFLNFLHFTNLPDPYAHHHRDYSMELRQNARRVREHF